MKPELEALSIDRLAAVTGGADKKKAATPRSPRRPSPRFKCDRDLVLQDDLGAYIPDC